MGRGSLAHGCLALTGPEGELAATTLSALAYRR